MGYDYFGARVFHAVVRLLNDGEMVTHETLYRLGLSRIIDRTSWLLEAMQRMQADLASTATGTRATIHGTKNLSTFTQFDAETNPLGELGPGGLLDGRTLSLDEDKAAAEHVAFVAPMTAADIVQQIIQGAPTNKGVMLDESSRLVLMSRTLGASSTLEVSGSAASVLGLPIGSAVGQAGADDGASKIGLAPHEPVDFPGGTVRSAIVKLMESVNSVVWGKADRAGDTFTGPVAFKGPVTFEGAILDAKWDFAPDVNATISTSKANMLWVPPPQAARTYTIAEPGDGPRRVRFIRQLASPNVVTIRRASDNGVLAVMMANGIAWVDCWYNGAMWVMIGWGGAVSGVG